MKQSIINKTVTIFSIDSIFLPNFGKLGSPRSLSLSLSLSPLPLSALSRSRDSLTSVADQFYSLSHRWGPEFASRSLHVGFVVDETGSGQVFLGVSPVFSYHKFHSNISPYSSHPFRFISSALVMVHQAWSAGTLPTHGPIIQGLHRISSLDPTLCWTRVEDIYFIFYLSMKNCIVHLNKFSLLKYSLAATGDHVTDLLHLFLPFGLKPQVLILIIAKTQGTEKESRALDLCRRGGLEPSESARSTPGSAKGRMCSNCYAIAVIRPPSRVYFVFSYVNTFVQCGCCCLPYIQGTVVCPL